MNYESEAQT